MNVQFSRCDMFITHAVGGRRVVERSPRFCALETTFPLSLALWGLPAATLDTSCMVDLACLSASAAATDHLAPTFAVVLESNVTVSNFFLTSISTCP